MPVFVARLLARLALLRSWFAPAAVIVFVFLTSWPLMALAEPGSELVQPANYWWWFVVTAATVGYGDFFPESLGGHLVGVYVIVGGIVALTALFTRLAGAIETARGRRMQGAITTRATGHIVLLGYTAGRTERLVDELLADGAGQVVLCAWPETGAHPMPGRDVEFVRGELTDDDVLRRAGVQRAATVLVDVRDDNEALAVTVAVDHVNPDTHLVVTLRDLGRAPHLGYVNGAVRCVQWHSPRMVTEEVKSPGITEVYAELMTVGGANTYSTALPASLGRVTFGDCQVSLGRTRGVTVLAARSGDRLLVNPGWQTELEAGTVLYYIAPGQLAPEDLATALGTR
jgi:voltage-gated potassium channel Kch